MNRFIQAIQQDRTNYVQRRGHIKIYVCPQCNQSFEHVGTHIDYRIGDLHFCTYTHKKEYEKKHD